MTALFCIILCSLDDEFFAVAVEDAFSSGSERGGPATQRIDPLIETILYIKRA